MPSSNSCFMTHIQVSQETGRLVWYSCLFKNFPPFVVFHTKTFSSVQFISVAQSSPTHCYLMDYSTPGLPVRHQLLEFTQTHVHWISDAIQLSHPLSTPSLPACNPSQHQDLSQCQFFTSGGRRFGASASASVLPMNIQDWFPLELTGLITLQSKRPWRVFSNTTV